MTFQSQFFRFAPHVLGMVVLVFLTAACGRARVTDVPNGGHRIVCERGMKLCVARADKLCGDDGYTVVSGRTMKKLLGGSSSSYRALAEVAELEVMCGQVEPKPPQEAFIALPPRSDEPAATPGQPTACVPGTSQLCVGSGACQGGQICAADGAGFGACDCGTAAPPSPSPSTTPSAPAPSVAPSGTALPGAAPPAEPLSR